MDLGCGRGIICNLQGRFVEHGHQNRQSCHAALGLSDRVIRSLHLRQPRLAGLSIDLFYADSVEVIYGSSAPLGMGGTGGIVNQVTIAPRQDGLSGRLSVKGNSDSEFSRSVTAIQVK